MKKIIGLLALLALCTPCLSAAVSPNTPLALTSIADGYHIGDNGAVGALRDVISGKWLASSSTLVYKQYYTSLNGGLAYLPNTPGANGILYPSVRAHFGELLSDRVAFIHNLVNSDPLVQSFLNYLTVGAWFTRDFDYGIYRGGYDLNFTVKF